MMNLAYREKKYNKKIEEKIKGKVFPSHSFCAIKVHLIGWLMQTTTLSCAAREHE